MLYQCNLVHKGVIRERFYREGNNAQEIKAGLELFIWPAGKWEIYSIDELED